jgi:hypothetical protein
VVEHKRRADADRTRPRSQQEQASLECPLYKLRRLLGCLELQGNHQAEPAHVGDLRVRLGYLAQPILELGADG